MRLIVRVLNRVVPPVLMAAGVTAIAAGLLSYTAPIAVGDFGGIGGGTGGTGGPSAVLSPSASRTQTGIAIADPTRPRPTPRASRPPGPTPTPSPSGDPPVASRVVVPALDIDLPVVSGDLAVAGNEGGYPLCDVSQYLTYFAQPGVVGTTYLYGHAREGMFLPLLQESERQNGKGILGALIQVYTTDGKVYLYELFQVKRHATDFDLANDLEPGEQRLILQTSEGPSGTVPKLQVAARFLNVQPGNVREATPKPHPVPCG